MRSIENEEAQFNTAKEKWWCVDEIIALLGELEEHTDAKSYF